jgi:hypothetical protein
MTTLLNNQNVDVAVGAVDAAGLPVSVTFDPGSVTATFADGAAFLVTISADEKTVNVKATGPLVTGDTLTVTASVAGVALTPATLPFDVQAPPPVAVTLTPGTPVAN